MPRANRYFLPGKLYGDQWYIDLQSDELNHEDFYQVEIKVKQGNRDYTAVYNKEGKLLSSKEIIHDAPQEAGPPEPEGEEPPPPA